MSKLITYDLPTRLFHWIFALLFVFAFFIAKTVDDDSPVFNYHMLAGIILGGITILRLIWGLVGTPYAKFSSFALNPKDLIAYFQTVFSMNSKKWRGHNPASSWATLTMLLSALILAGTGILMTTGYKENFEDLHELFANIFLITVLLHIAGLLLHSFKYKDGIALSMLHGKKESTPNSTLIVKSRPLTALFFLCLLGWGVSYIIKNYNANQKELMLLGKRLTLGETEDKADQDHGKIENSDEDDD